MTYAEIVAFHGHSCPGSAIGYRMTRAAMTFLAVDRSGDEELVAIVENDACGVDALQCMTGCTFGKGNLIFRDYGKPVYTLFSRTSGKGVRVRFLDSALPEEIRNDRGRKLEYILAAADDVILSVAAVSMHEPKRAQLHTTVSCDRCHESVMETRLREINGQRVCIPCANEADKRGDAMTTAVLIMAHGSRIAEANDAARDVAKMVEEMTGIAIIEVAFREMHEPDIQQGIDTCVARGADKILLIPYFLFMGAHVQHDLPEEIEAAQQRHPGLEMVMGPHLGAHRKLAEIVSERISEGLTAAGWN